MNDYRKLPIPSSDVDSDRKQKKDYVKPKLTGIGKLDSDDPRSAAFDDVRHLIRHQDIGPAR
jgi:hypothetical protein